MTISRLPSGRWRARVWSQGRDVPVASVLGLPAGTTFATRREAKAAVARARELLRGGGDLSTMTVRDFWETWTTSDMYRRPKDSTNRHNRERTKGFVEAFGDRPLRNVNRVIVNQWLANNRNRTTVPALRAMWNDAIRSELTERNPFERLGFAKSRGNRDVKPPSQEIIWQLVEAAREFSGPSFSGWLTLAAFTGMRPGEIDALRWDAIDLERNRILVREQFSGTSGVFTLPKNGRRREAPLTPPAREALLAQGRANPDDFCFVNLRNHHWTPGSRAYHWKATKAAVGFKGSLYLATRHHAGDYMTNVLGLAAEDVAIALGHTDGGYLVRVLYGHRDEQMALDRVLRAYEDRANVVPLRRGEAS
jgi:integrase